MKIIFEEGDIGRKPGTYEFYPDHTQVEMDWGQQAIRVEGTLGKRADPGQFQNAAYALALAFSDCCAAVDWDFIDRESEAYEGTQKEALAWAVAKVKQHLFEKAYRGGTYANATQQIAEAERKVKEATGLDVTAERNRPTFKLALKAGVWPSIALGRRVRVTLGEVTALIDDKLTTLTQYCLADDGEYFVETMRDSGDYALITLRHAYKAPEGAKHVDEAAAVKQEAIELTVFDWHKRPSLGMVYEVKCGRITYIDDKGDTMILKENFSASDGEYFVERIDDLLEGCKITLRQQMSAMEYAFGEECRNYPSKPHDDPVAPLAVAFKVGDFVTFDAEEWHVPVEGPWKVLRIEAGSLIVHPRNAKPGDLPYMVPIKDCTPAGGPVNKASLAYTPEPLSYPITHCGSEKWELHAEKILEEDRTEGDDLMDFFRQRHDV